MSVAKAHGLNHLRFHSWCPPEAAFEAADELGVMFQIEGPFWAEFGKDTELDTYAYAECERILSTYGNHPSFCMLAISNEPSGKNMNLFFAEIIQLEFRASNGRRLAKRREELLRIVCENNRAIPQDECIAV